MDAYVGQIKLFAGGFAPVNWMFCNGALLAITQYEVLYSLIGTVWGGNGVSNFALPDLRGRVPVGQGQGPGLTNRFMAEVGGTSTVQLTMANYPTHNHNVMATNKSANALAVAAGVGLATTAKDTAGFTTRYADSTATGTNAPTPVPMDEISITNSGASGPLPHSNIMPYVAINYIICFNGLYPSRS